MAPSKANRYDVRVWGHIYALDLFCRIKDSGRFDDLQSQYEPWISKLTKCVVEEELERGGWNYAGRRSHAGFVTAAALQALLWARQVGEDVPMDVFQRGSDALFRSRNGQAAFAYSGDDRKNRSEQLPGSIAARRTVKSRWNCWATLGKTPLNSQSIRFTSIGTSWKNVEKKPGHTSHLSVLRLTTSTTAIAMRHKPCKDCPKKIALPNIKNSLTCSCEPAMKMEPGMIVFLLNQEPTVRQWQSFPCLRTTRRFPQVFPRQYSLTLIRNRPRQARRLPLGRESPSQNWLWTCRRATRLNYTTRPCLWKKCQLG